MHEATPFNLSIEILNSLQRWGVDWLKRWPWYVLAQNSTPNFGSTWSRHNLWINSLKDEFLIMNPDKAITAAGGQTLGALNYGKDKLKLSPDFAKFIIGKVMTINDRP